MRYFFRRRIPRFDRALLVESGSRAHSERFLPQIRRNHGAVAVDIVTCYAGIPAGYPPDTRVFHVGRYAGRAGRKRLYRELQSAGYQVLGILCSDEPIMTKWKWALVARVPAKVFIVNENADYFWLDYSSWRILVRFALYRSGLAGAGAARTLLRAVLAPFTLAYLLLSAAMAHFRRLLRAI
jgi:hypothetical protein